MVAERLLLLCRKKKTKFPQRGEDFCSRSFQNDANDEDEDEDNLTPSRDSSLDNLSLAAAIATVCPPWDRLSSWKIVEEVACPEISPTLLLLSVSLSPNRLLS